MNKKLSFVSIELRTMNKRIRTKRYISIVLIALSFVFCIAINAYAEDNNQQLVTKLAISSFGTENSLNLKIGSTSMVAVMCFPRNATNKTLKWTSSDEQVATVTEGGTINAKSVGTCVISCETTDGSNLKQSVNVKVELKHPISLESVRVDYNSIGVPQVAVSVKNVGDNQDIIAFTFATKCYDAYGYELKAFGFGEATKYWIWQEGKLRPGKSTANDDWWWTLNGFDTAYQIDVWLTDYRTADGTTVTISPAEYDIVTWKKFE